MIKHPSRIYILGTAGSGKSFFAKQISCKLKILCYDLDDLYWYKKYTKKRDKAKRKSLLRDIINKRKWIIEGVYSSWIESALKKADKIILLDTPILIIAYRILKRYLIKKIRTEESNLKGAIGLIKYASRYKKEKHSSSFKKHLDLLKKNNLKFEIIKNKSQMKHLLECI